jgi:SSS family solute:Na+ symporter
LSPALVVLAACFAAAFGLGLLARRGRSMSLEQWSVGGRGFGALFVFLLMAGEIYTTFTFLGGSGWAYGRGAPAFYILGYGALAFSLSYFLLPAIWRYATEHGLHSQADWFAHRYASPALGVVVSLVTLAAMTFYLVLQLKGLGIIVSETSYGTVSPPTAVWLGVTGLVVYVVISGVHGSAWTAVLKDIMILAVAVGLGLYLPFHWHGGVAGMFEGVERAKPGFLTLPARGMSPTWFVSTVLLSAAGFYTWPHAFAASYTAKNEDVFRKNAIVMPLYQLVLLFIMLVGFSAVTVVPGLSGAQADLSLLRISKLTFAPWLVGLIGGAGVLTALVPGSMLLITMATVLVKNVLRPVMPGLGERTLGLAARGVVPGIALVAALLALHGGEAIVPLLLMGYNLVTQLFPAMILGLAKRPFATREGALAGVVTGVVVVVLQVRSGLTLAKVFPALPPSVTDLNVGVVAVAANALVLVIVSAATRRRTGEGR